MKVLVTGAGGFIGSEITAKLLSENYEVVGLSGTGRQQNSGLRFFTADITEEKSLEPLLTEGNFDAVIHCAGLAHQFGKIEPERFENVNVKGTKNIALLAAKLNVRHLILLSSTAVYGLQETPMDETAECRPETVYAETKLKAENVCIDVCEKNRIALTIFRLAPVLGEKGIGNVPRLIDSIYKKRFIWIGKGSNKKSLIDVGDVAEACLVLISKKRNGTEIFNLASKPLEMRRLVSLIASELNKTVPKLFVPAFLPEAVFALNSKVFKLGFIERISQTFEKWLSEDIYPAEKIKNAYGFQTRTGIEESVAKQCAWYLRKFNK